METLAACALVIASSAACLTANPAMHQRATGEALVVDSRGYLRQGRAAVDEQDFYEIAGDAAAVQAVRGRRAKIFAAELATQLGVGYGGVAGAVVGGGALAGGIVWTVIDGPIGLIGLIPGALLLTASIVAIPLGFAYAADIGDEMYDPVLPGARAEAAARRYNQRLGRRGRPP